METDLRRRKIRNKVPMTFVTSEPYIGHLGLGGVGDSNGILESAMRDKHIKWICNAKVTKIEAGKMYVTEHDDMGQEKKKHELPFNYSMMLPAFKGVDAVFGIEGLTNPRGFITVDKHQRNGSTRHLRGRRVRRHPAGRAHPVPVGTPQDRLHDRVDGDRHRGQHTGRPDQPAGGQGSDLERGVPGRLRRDRRGLRSDPQIPPRNVNWFSEGKWVHLAKVAFEKYFIRKMKKGTSEPFYEGSIMKMLGIEKLK